MTLDGNIYYLQYAIFTNLDVLNDNIDKLDDYYLVTEDNKYYVYLGAYTDLLKANEMQKEYEKNGIYTYIKNDYLGNMDIVDKIKEKESENKDIKLINKEILEILRKK